MKNIREKLKSKWVLTIVIIVLVFLIKDIINIFLKVDFNNFKTNDNLFYIYDHIGYSIGILSHPILDTTILYALLFKIEIVENE